MRHTKSMSVLCTTRFASCFFLPSTHTLTTGTTQAHNKRQGHKVDLVLKPVIHGHNVPLDVGIWVFSHWWSVGAFGDVVRLAGFYPLLCSHVIPQPFTEVLNDQRAELPVLDHMKQVTAYVMVKYTLASVGTHPILQLPQGRRGRAPPAHRNTVIGESPLHRDPQSSASHRTSRWPSVQHSARRFK
jgi:hypothetical protein